MASSDGMPYTILISFLCAILAYALWPSHRCRARPTTHEQPPLPPGAVLLVIAHPDDEALFFGPTIRSLVSAGYDVHVLCLSIGIIASELLAAANTANVEVSAAFKLPQLQYRVSELRASCNVLGIPARNIHIADQADQNFIDGPHIWLAKDIVAQVFERIRQTNAQSILTFDDYGVSGHPNHRAISMALREEHLPKNTTLWKLASVPIWRKYIPLVDRLSAYTPPSAKDSDNWWAVRSDARDLAVVMHAFNQHKSQIRWFRRLNVIFSHYLILNELYHDLAKKKM